MRITPGKVLRQARRVGKVGFGLLRPRRPLDEKTVLFILGCQRSGTTLMTQIFERDWNAKVFPEESRLSSDDNRHRIRLNRLDKVVATLEAERFPFVVAKPLVESQNVLRLLEHVPGAQVVWLYRPVHDVVASDLRHFGERNGIDNIRPIALADGSDWRAEHASAETRRIVSRFFAEDMNIHDAAALFWLARNALYFDNGLDGPDLRRRVMPLRYEALTRDPEGVMRRLYDFVGRPFAGAQVVSEVHQDSVGKGRTVGLSPEIEAMCRDLLSRLDNAAGYRQ